MPDMLQQNPATPTPTATLTPGPAFEPRPSLAERLNLRVVVFVIVVVLPLVALGYVYVNTALSSGIRELPDGYVWVDLQKMSSFAFDQRNGTIDQVPQRWRELDGRKVVLEGEMAPTRTSAGEVTEFDLVYSVANCCYSGTPQVQHFVHSTVVDGGKVRFYSRPVRVHGTLRVNVTREDGQVTGVYQLEVEKVEPLT